MANASLSMVAVWEWYTEFSTWRGYEPHISDCIERHSHQKGVVLLGNFDPTMSNYVVDLSGMQQLRQNTGTRRPVRRKLYPPSSPAGTGALWQWSGDIPGSWNSYDMEAQCILEDAFSRNIPLIDLSHTPCQVPYTIDLVKLEQRRNETGYVRKVQRIKGNRRFSAANPNAVIPAANMGQQHGAGAMNNNSGASTSQGNTMLQNSPLYQALSSGSNVGNPYNMLPSGNPLHKSGGVVKKKAQMGNTYNSSPKLTRQNVRSIAAQHQQFHLQQQQQQQQLLLHQQQQQILGFPMMAHQHIPNPQMPQQTANPFMNGGVFPPNVQQLSHLPPARLPYGQQYPVYLPGQSAAPLQRSQPHMMPTGPPMAPVINPNMTASSTGAEAVIKKFGAHVKDPPNDTDCCICCEGLHEASGYTSDDTTVYKLKKCGHMYHYSCVKAMYENGTKDGSLVCPTCKEIYGEKRGNCPAGQMQVSRMAQSLPGHPECGTIRVEYYINPGLQGPEHPVPGQPYSARGFPRYGYFPDNERGNKLVKMLQVAWERRLTFTLGTSVTTSETNTVVWNEIHHKTEFGSNRSGHGYPDPKYMDNLTMELSAQGITEGDISS